MLLHIFWRTRDPRRRGREPWVLLVLLVFTAGTVVRHRNVSGDDLSSSYVGCKVLAAGQPAHLYSHDAHLFTLVSDPLWDDIGDASGFSEDGELHPYVQTPLWAFALRPLCTHTSFPQFNGIFLLLGSFAFAGTIWLVARFWAPRLLHPGWIATVCVALYFSEPYKYALLLTQTHILFIFLSVAALVCARGRYPVAAGALLAVAAAVKLTPGFLLLYWLLTRRWRAAGSFVAFSVLFAVLTVATSGWALTAAYLRNLSEVSNVLLVSWNNQSLAAWWMGRAYGGDELQMWRIHGLPPVVKAVSLLLSIGSTAAGGLLDRRAGASAPPYGAVLAMVGATLFTPIAWTHYYVLLLLPLMLLLDASLRRRSILLGALAVLVFGLSFDGAALGGVLLRFRLFTLVRDEFYAGLLSMLGLLLLCTRPWGPGRGNHQPPSSIEQPVRQGNV